MCEITHGWTRTETPVINQAFKRKTHKTNGFIITLLYTFFSSLKLACNDSLPHYYKALPFYTLYYLCKERYYAHMTLESQICLVFFL
jgi:hypothetical protein